MRPTAAMGRVLLMSCGDVRQNRALLILPTMSSSKGVTSIDRPGYVVANIDAVFKTGKKRIDKRMTYRELTCIRREVFGGCISACRGAVDQHMIPRLISFRLSLILLIPCVVCFAAIIPVHNNPAIAIATMSYQLTRLKFRSVCTRASDGNHENQGGLVLG